MRIVWVTNLPIGSLAEKLGVTASSGSWIYAALKEITIPSNEVFVITTCKIKDKIAIKENNVTFIGLPTGDPSAFSVCKRTEGIWRNELADLKPDVLQVWGTEYRHAIVALKTCPNLCKKYIYVQGIMDSIYKNYYGGISRISLLKCTSIIELLTNKTLFCARKKALENAKIEKESISLSDGVILETEWSSNYCNIINPSKKIYKHKLPLNQAFCLANWSVGTVERHSIFTSASDYPLKGLQYLIEALYYIKRRYPDVILYVPGAIIKREFTIKEYIRQRAYRKYLRSIIERYDLWDNVRFVGILSSQEMANYMSKANVFVCSSVIENHSSTLREAMLVGTPCISGAVGGIPEYLINNQNGLLVDPEDDIALAGNIIKIFENDELAMKLSLCAHETIAHYYSQREMTLQDIYDEVIKREESNNAEEVLRR